jgi:hypothetical protein
VYIATETTLTSEFNLLVSNFTLNTKRVTLRFEQSNTLCDLSNVKGIKDFFFNYFYINLESVRISFKFEGEDENMSIYQILKGGFIKTNYFKNNPEPEPNETNVIKREIFYFGIKVHELEEKIISANPEYAIYHNIRNSFNSIALSAIKDYIDKNFNSKDFPTWWYASIYIVAFAQKSDFQRQLPIDTPDESEKTRPDYYSVFRNIIYGQGDLIYGLSGEQKIQFVQIESLMNVFSIYPISFCDTGENFILACIVTNKSLKNQRIEHAVVKLNNTSLLSFIPLSTSSLSPKYSAIIPIDFNSQAMQSRRHLFQMAYTQNQNQLSIIRAYTEAYYFIPISIALKLQENGYFEEALAWYRSVYDYNWKNIAQRKIWYGLIAEEAVNTNYNLAPNWLIDPMNPHQIALTRAGAYTAYTIQNIVKCLLDYADQEYTKDTVESIPIATHLYEEVLELMRLPQFSPNQDACECASSTLNELWDKLKCLPNIGFLLRQKQAIDDLGYLLDQIEASEDKTACEAREEVINQASTIFNDKKSRKEINEAIGLFKNKIIEAISVNLPPINLHGLATKAKISYPIYLDKVWSVQGYNLISESISTAVYDDAVVTAAAVTGWNTATLLEDSTNLNFTTQEYDSPAGEYTQGNQVYADDRVELVGGSNSAFSLINHVYEDMPLYSLRNDVNLVLDYSPMSTAFSYCIPENPVYESYRLKAELNLFKIRNCMNIAGMKRDLDPYAAPTDATTGMPSIGAGGRLNVPGQLVIKPTQYRYIVLIQRAKELAQLAQQFENMYLSALEKKDAETFTLLKAKQELRMSKEGVKLNNHKVKVSEGEVDLSKLQKERYELQVEQLDEFLQAGLNQFEIQLKEAYSEIAKSSVQLAILQAQLTMDSAAVGLQASLASAIFSANMASTPTPASAGFAQSAVMSGIQAAQYGFQLSYANSISQAQQGIARAQGQASTLTLLASQENREREWRFQKVLAEQDVKIAQQQIRIAQDRLRVSGQELKMAELQQNFAEDSLEFLQNKFTNADLYNWMSRVLAAAYSTVLSEATATAKMAMYQLMFDRQESPLVEISDNYWEAPSMSVSLEPGSGPDRNGLTGSTRLLQDLTRMDQWAFTSNTRKLEITKTISLARAFPLEFQQFRETGKITFNTLMQHFDRDFPGHYMRIINRVQTNVVALVPPTEGIKATLTSSGISEVVIKGDRFQSTFIRRTSERIALSVPSGNTGILELQPQGEQFTNPFEGNGVAMQWEFEMPIESNSVEYSSISDVLITIQYTAMDSPDYRTEVLRKLPKEFEGEKLYSLRSDFSDQFYQLSNPDEITDRYKISFDTLFFDFPGNLKDIYIRGLRIMLLGYSSDLDNPNNPITKQIDINFNAFNSNDSIEGNAILDAKNFAGTIGGGGTGMLNFIGQGIDGKWTFNFSPLNVALGQGDYALKRLIDNGEIVDILFVIDFAAKYKNS